MTPAFVKTRNFERFSDAVSTLEERGADECILIVVDGQPGLGKTTILSHWAADQNCSYLRAKKEYSPYWFLGELLQLFRLQPPYGYEKRFNAALQALSERASTAEVSGKQFAVVIDEADHISCRTNVMETIRDLSDLTEVAFVLVGMGRIRDNLVRFPQISSRVSSYVRFEPADLADVQHFLDEKCDLKVAPDLAGFIRKATGGFNREIMEAIKSVELHGHRNPAGDLDLGLTMAEMAGQHLINDRRSGQAISVPGGL